MLDHGILNVPLAKRGSGCINAQLDRFKAQQARDAKAERKVRAEQTRQNKSAAKALFAEVGALMIDACVAKGGDRKGLRDMLDGWMKWQPSKFIAIATRFKAERNL